MTERDLNLPPPLGATFRPPFMFLFHSVPAAPPIQSVMSSRAGYLPVIILARDGLQTLFLAAGEQVDTFLLVTDFHRPFLEFRAGE